MGETVTIQKNWQELIRPNKLQVTAGSDPARIATVVAEPLERGFGVTLGNALRRILLSSLQGAAVQSVLIDGVLHEFSSIAGVREDVTDMVLNIKDIAIKMQGEGPKRMVVKKQGPGMVTAGDIQTVGDIVVLNPDLILCTLDEGAEILMIPSAFTLATGKDHWEPLIRARAIETQCWVIAPAQHGKHDDGGLAHTWGHAMIVDPWGIPVATAADGPGLALAEIDLDRVARIRQAIPVARHRRL